MDLFGGGFFVVVILLVVLGTVVTIAWWVAVAYFGLRAWRAITRELDTQLPAIEQLLRQCASMPPGQRTVLQGTILNQLGQMNLQMQQLDALQRQRYDLRVSELQGMAASAGIDWSPSSY